MEKVALGAISCTQSFAPLLNQGAKDKPCVAKMNNLFAPQLLRAEFLISDEKSGLKFQQHPIFYSKELSLF
ncbi:MAG: hypothetical protein A3G33_11495 [Omnitrophica bacterium RIFCSPLOWO2_12_FULL_44_17]|uniref:Uncharacterized protein n=1 Tax=Candidatus Danuiimicrobium aquiferis TaxID=1801832 RepID=A0A1G1KRS0_9BACT|nr:MAG: hypothetical protein A3B72_09335 [Omnitrophica bacterium RIFCSPHIGHO2_02_FULL_45_28]OGW91212.1 MAG: hypothetical protein A3E74_02865 [Omnitrophica bacterium RIFCSPHIGHO2_12_FULL_44_12]OGW95613.1 MAG: hypothetical protein A3G33_11495 [Omnitrophica bacterium RIFCSPLOWO2_12_FULL_44_17]OGX03674.1 MAG: hypothetical protein A3J12_01000 [Omnitrophica bacterium RIFCSPLOWO2_02_FULL_44_11]